MASLPYPLNWLDNHGRVGMSRMPYPPIDCQAEFVGMDMDVKYNKMARCHIDSAPFYYILPINYLA